MNTKAPRRLVVKKGMTNGYRGYPNPWLEVECGHIVWFYNGSHAPMHNKAVVGKTRMKCWDCYTASKNNLPSNPSTNPTKG